MLGKKNETRENSLGNIKSLPGHILFKLYLR